MKERVEDLGRITEKMFRIFELIDGEPIFGCYHKYKEEKVSSFKELTDSDEKILGLIFSLQAIKDILYEINQIARWGDEEEI